MNWRPFVGAAVLLAFLRFFVGLSWELIGAGIVLTTVALLYHSRRTRRRRPRY